MADSPHLHWSAMKTLRAILVLAFAYALCAHLALLLALPPGYATAIFPASGIALAAITTYGARLLPGVALGAFAVNLLLGLRSADAAPLQAVLAALTIAAGSTLQAGLGSALLRRWIRPSLDSSRDVLLFLLLAPVMCVASASIAIPGLHWLGLMPAASLPANWLTWWVGDSIGVLLGAPLAWIVIGQPRSLWQHRRWMLSLPLAVSSAAFILIYLNASRWEQEQQMQNFRLKSQQVGNLLQGQFSEHERIIHTLAGLFAQRQMPQEAEFRDVARSYLNDRPELRSMLWIPRVSAPERMEFEAWARRQIAADFAISEIRGLHQTSATRERALYFPVTYMEPVAGNAHVLGVDMFSEPRRAAAITRAITHQRPSASAPIFLVHKEGDKAGILLVQAIRHHGQEAPDIPAGVLTVTLEIEPYIQRTMAQADFDYALTRFADITDADLPSLMLDGITRAAQSGDYQQQLTLGGRTYELTLAPTAAYLAAQRGWQSWTTLAGGLMLSGLLGAFLLLMSGQRVRMEHVVQARTRELQEREAKLTAILDKAVDAILTIGRDGRVVSVNRATGKLFGHALETMHGMPFEQLVQLGAGSTGLQVLERLSQRLKVDDELTGCYADGQNFPLSVAVSLVEVTNETFFVCILRDLTEQHRAQDKIFQLAHHDPLTGLANRFTLNLRLQQLLAEAARTGGTLALMFIDLDHFKKINDTLGHHAGDQLLVQAGARLKELLPQAAIIARLGNDEYIIAFDGEPGVETISTAARDIITRLREPFEINSQRLQSGASIGIARFPQDGSDADTLLRNADAAVLAAKLQGRGKFQFFTAELNAAAQERLQMEHRIWLGLEHGEFELYLQPQIHLASRKIIGAEALLRWRQPELGFIAPDRFIPIAEDSGLILPLGEWVLARALHILADWQKRDMPPLRLAVNLSARQCNSGTLIACLDRLHGETGADLQWLEMEITETAAMQDPEQTRELLRALRTRGVKVAIDDFGTGYSSLSYLKLFEIDRIKIDRSFVKDIENDENDAVIASATIALAHTLGLEVVAEGIETEAQCTFLNHELCDEGQGYLFGKAVPLAEFEKLLAEVGARGMICYA